MVAITALNGRLPSSALARFWAHVSVGGPDDCWLWTGARSGDYGSFSMHGRVMSAHRAAFILATGIEPGPLDVNHDCHTAAIGRGECAGGSCEHRLCVNPRHLSLMTRRENNLAGALSWRATGVCRNGVHEIRGPADIAYNGVNGSTPRFTCRACKNARQRRYERGRSQRLPH